MNIPTTSTPDLEGLRKAVQEFRSNPHRIPFTNLKPVHDSIAELRKRSVSYAGIAELLQQHGVKTSRARVAEYGRIVLDGGKSRKRRKKRAKAALVAPQPSMTAVTTKPPPSPVTATAENILPPAKENSAFVSRGPRIAKVEMLSPEEAAAFNASLKAEKAPKP
jgi:hypothetical protein